MAISIPKARSCQLMPSELQVPCFIDVYFYGMGDAEDADDA